MDEVRFDDQSFATVLLHGFAGHPEDWRSTWEAAGGPPGARALALPGHLDLPAPTTFEEAVDLTLARLPEHPINVIGYSLGGRIGLGMAARSPERIRRLILVSAHTGLSDPHARSARLERDQGLAKRLRSDAPAFFRWWDTLPLFGTNPTPNLTAWRQRRAQHDPERLAQSMVGTSLGRMPCLSHTVATHPDATLVVGSEDRRFRDHYATLTRCAHHVPVHVVSDAAHRVLADAPAALGPILAAALTTPEPA